MTDATYRPNLSSLEREFPPGLPPPELLRSFALWLAEQPRSSLGWFHLEGERLPSSLIANDDVLAALRSELAVFVRLPSGTRLALFRQPDGPAAVVRIRSLEDRALVAPDLDTFLVALSRGETGLPELDRNPNETAPARARLARWLEARGVGASDRALAADSFDRWFESTVAQTHLDPLELPQSATALPPDLFERAGALIGSLSDDPRVVQFFAELGLPLERIRDPERLRFLALPRDGVVFSIAWPWDFPSEWLAAEFPASERPDLERRRARMFWSIELIVAPERRVVPRTRETVELAAYGGQLPFGLEASDDVDRAEAKLGPPIVGRYGYRLWDHPAKLRSLTLGFNEGALIRPDLPRGALTWVRWQRSQSL